jgi:hypothetical protein
MPVLVTRGMVEQLRLLFGAALDERYTRVPLVAVLDGQSQPLLDDWGQQVTEPGVPVAGLACKLRLVETVSHDDRGAFLLRQPTLWVRHDDPLAVGDSVQDVRDGEGRLLLSRAAVVRVEATPVGPGTVTTAAELEGAEAIPLPAPEGV